MVIHARSVAQAAVASAILLLAACAATPPQSYAWKAPAIGSTWEMAYHNTGSFGADKRVQVRVDERMWNGARMLAYLHPDGSGTLRTADHNRVAVVLGPGGKTVAEYTPPGGLTFPIKVGDSVTTHSQLAIPGRDSRPFMDMTCVVQAYEEVTVPAGTFDAYRTVCTPSSGKSVDTFWMSPKLGIHIKTAATRAQDSNFGPGTQVAELVSYSLR